MSKYHNHPLSGLRQRREMQNIKARDLAKRLGMVYQSYLRLERGERICTLDKALTIARTLGCTVEQLGNVPSVDEQVEAYRAAIVNEALAPPNDIPGTVVIGPQDGETEDDWIARLGAELDMENP